MDLATDDFEPARLIIGLLSAGGCCAALVLLAIRLFAWLGTKAFAFTPESPECNAQLLDMVVSATAFLIASLVLASWGLNITVNIKQLCGAALVSAGMGVALIFGARGDVWGIPFGWTLGSFLLGLFLGCETTRRPPEPSLRTPPRWLVVSAMIVASVALFAIATFQPPFEFGKACNMV